MFMLQAFKNHELHDPLIEPGSADLTADVDFTYLKQCIKGGIQNSDLLWLLANKTFSVLRF